MANSVELARGSFEAFASGDLDAYIGFFSEDCEWRNSAFLTGKDHYEGHDGIREFIADVTRLREEHGEEFIANITDFTEVDEKTVLGLGKGRILRDQNPLEFETGIVYRFAGDKISELEVYTSHEEARRAAGLS